MLTRVRSARAITVALLVASVLTTAAAAPEAEAATSVRYAGENRFATAAALSESHFEPGVAAVYVASGRTFADALTGAPAAARLGSPLLLTEPASLPEATRTALERLQPARIVVLGGPSAIADAVASELQGYTSGTVVRLQGANRAATAAAVAIDAWPEGSEAVLIADGGGFADALSGGAAGAAVDAPILLVDDNGVPTATRDAILRLGASHVQILGGTAAVSSATRAQLEELAVTVDRWSGDDRYGTSAAIANGAFGHVDTAVLAVGTDYADALAAGTAAATLGAPVLLTTTNCIPVTIGALLGDMGIEDLVIAGGTSAISESAAAGTTCGTVPAPLHFTTLYLYPSDAVPLDRDQAIRDTLDEMNAWVTDQTGGHRIRLSRSGGEITVQSLRLPFTTAELTPTPTDDKTQAWADIYLWLLDLDLITPRQQVAAFVESMGSSCGRGGTGLALMWLHSCNSEFGVDDPRQLLSAFAGIMIHEMLHTFGAVPTCAPNIDDTESAPSHITESETTDIMFAVYNPFRDVDLDPGADDYYGHGRLDCADVVRARYWELDPAWSPPATTSTTTASTSTTTTTP